MNPQVTVVLVEPQIPPNTGNIARLCAANNTPLHLVGELGFDLSDKQLKRAGMDYWKHVTWTHFPDISTYFQDKNPNQLHFFSSKSTKQYTDAIYAQHDYLILGSETTGLPQWLHEQFPDRFRTIPMYSPHDDIRCLNLSTATGIVVYEAFRQLNVASQSVSG